MKTKLILFSILLAVLASCGKTEKPLAPLSEQHFKFEIYDSLVVDYLGNLFLADISEDEKKFLLIDQQTDTIFVTNDEGKILHKYTRKGDGPGYYQQTRLGPPQFLTDSEIIFPAYDGFHVYSLSGEPVKTYSPDFDIRVSLINLFKNNLIIQEEQIIFPFEGRIADEYGVEGREFQQKVKKLEVANLISGDFTPALPFPKASKFSSAEKSHLNINYALALSKKDDSLYVAFRNEPVIYSYHLSDLDSPASIYKISFPEFIEKEPKDADKFGQYEMKDVYTGSLNQVFALDNKQFLANYARGLTDEEFEQISSEFSDDNSKLFEELRKKNTTGWVLYDGSSVSRIIEEHPNLGFMGKFISKDKIWFSLDFQEVEKDYSIFYKTKILSK